MNTLLNNAVNLSRPSPTLVPLARTRQLPTSRSKLSDISHLPTASFLVDRQLRVVDSNGAAKRLVDHGAVSIRDSALSLGSTDNTQLARFAAQRVTSAAMSTHQLEPLSERLYLKLDGKTLFSITVSKANVESPYLLLCISGDLDIAADQRTPCKRVQQFAKTFGLSKCETRVIALMIQGQKPKQIAYNSNISVHTVRSHLRALYAKMQVRDFNDALILSVRLLASS